MADYKTSESRSDLKKESNKKHENTCSLMGAIGMMHCAYDFSNNRTTTHWHPLNCHGHYLFMCILLISSEVARVQLHIDTAVTI